MKQPTTGGGELHWLGLTRQENEGCYLLRSCFPFGSHSFVGSVEFLEPPVFSEKALPCVHLDVGNSIECYHTLY